MVRPLTPHIRATSSRVTTANGCCLCFVFFLCRAELPVEEGADWRPSNHVAAKDI